MSKYFSYDQIFFLCANIFVLTWLSMRCWPVVTMICWNTLLSRAHTRASHTALTLAVLDTERRLSFIVKLRQGSGKDRQGMAKGLKAFTLA